ncbi:hypothetical protein RJ53_10445 [Methanocalculus chunghsingensis]|uniref:Uncharacterized protein n=1 Tax=Methanocalculus chunghsingensis TaxID=156457 RepID=A0A8J7WBU5_9EURY|nr:hypothetical protein [Methanocalculus chunghsingensis]
MIPCRTGDSAWSIYLYRAVCECFLTETDSPDQGTSKKSSGTDQEYDLYEEYDLSYREKRTEQHPKNTFRLHCSP